MSRKKSKVNDIKISVISKKRLGLRDALWWAQVHILSRGRWFAPSSP
jgi:hypothetical protein